MNYREVPPSPRLAPYVRCFWRLRGDAAAFAGAAERILPDGCGEVIVNRADPFRQHGREPTQPRVMLVGQIRRYLRVVPTGEVDLVGVRFQPFGLHALLRLPAAEVTDARPDLGAFDARLRKELEDAARKGVVELEDALLRRLRPRALRSREAVARILAGGGRVRVDALARELRLGHRSLERAFRREVGLPPKLFARIVRFQGVIAAAERARRLDWAGLAPGCGYFDQAHLIRDFRHFAGRSPGAWFREEHPMADFFAGVSDPSNPGGAAAGSVRP